MFADGKPRHVSWSWPVPKRRLGRFIAHEVDVVHSLQTWPMYCTSVRTDDGQYPRSYCNKPVPCTAVVQRTDLGYSIAAESGNSPSVAPHILLRRDESDTLRPKTHILQPHFLALGPEAHTQYDRRLPTCQCNPPKAQHSGQLLNFREMSRFSQPTDKSPRLVPSSV